MKLLVSGFSPFVRKVLVSAHELGVAPKIETLPMAANPVVRDPALRAHNPLGKIPALILDDGRVLYDSRVICEYLDATFGPRLIPSGGQQRWEVLRRQALADGMLDALLLVRYEGVTRAEAMRSADWVGGQFSKVDDAMAVAEREITALPRHSWPDLGAIATACALGYLDLRFPDRDWRASHPQLAGWYAEFSQRPSMQASAPPPA